MPKGKKQVVEEGEIMSFLKTDKSRILELKEELGKFTVVGVYVRVDIPDVPLAGFHPKPTKNASAAPIKIGITDMESDAGGGEEKLASDPLYASIGVPSEQVNQIIEGINAKKSPRDICREVGVQFRTFMKVYGKLKELGRLDANYELNAAPKKEFFKRRR